MYVIVNLATKELNLVAAPTAADIAAERRYSVAILPAYPAGRHAYGHVYWVGVALTPRAKHAMALEWLDRPSITLDRGRFAAIRDVA